MKIANSPPLDLSAMLVLSVINLAYCRCTGIRNPANLARNLAGAGLGRIPDLRSK